MEFDAFSGGVAPGGLRTKNDIRILICYILGSVNAPLSEQVLLEIFQKKALANFFEVTDSLSSLVKNGHVEQKQVEHETCYSILPSGREIAENLDTTLPLSVRDNALQTALSLLAHAKVTRENKVEIEPVQKGYQVTCHISGGKIDLMSITVYVPDKKQAEMVKHHFHENPERIYQLLLASLTGEKSLHTSFFET